jgi:hypothetical protein
MLRKLVIIGSIAALFVLTAAPAFGLSVNTGPGHGDDTQTPKEVISVGDASAGESNPAHGPACGAGLTGAIECDEGQGVSTDNPGKPGQGTILHEVNGGDAGINFNVGAWNAVFGPGGMSNTNSAICGIGTVGIEIIDGGFDPENTCDPVN